MHHPSRPPNPSNGSTAVAATEGSGADPEPAGAAGASAQKSRSNEERSVGQRSSAGGEPDSPPWCPASLGVFQTRSIFHLPRRSSSGYFSADGADSVPSSPLFLKRLTADKATQTRSPSGQVIEHAMGRMADEAHGGGPGTQQQHGHSLNPSSTRRRNAGVMQAEAVGRALRRIGDDYDRILMRVADEHRRAAIPLNAFHQEPATLVCFSVMVLLLGWIIYSANRQV
ncbi:bcl-2-like protein 11 isoform X2 [Stegastes partitus]|uniref:Bcl-2-like protein 11 isoform X2 n=1 Tax=Stegastes partitus TaxID=144197 RepID=A0A9Y4KDY9_9TELE|nr:PREDICTED: bcl-2-like protein 11 isoform X2 [Stegastes partitus]